MTIKLIAAAITVASLSACAGELGGPPPAPIEGGAYSNSVGFTGISYQPPPRVAPGQAGTIVYVDGQPTLVQKRRY
ncbi:hypothetical protein [Sulfitobacter sp. JB4-11]|uniref:hypothetical protein n=1 Tax=Sulfitobacter rhodophyticola TaxID=3238304 RepID=UPI003510EB3E